jgi:non-ribosomal peptide synthetase component E (peptide arylation enzyme)
VSSDILYFLSAVCFFVLLSCCVARYKITYLPLIPSLVHQLVNNLKTKNADLSSLLWVYSGAGYLPDQLARSLMGIVPKQISMAEGGVSSSHKFQVII